MKRRAPTSKPKPLAQWIPVFDMRALGKFQSSEELFAAVKKIKAVLGNPKAVAPPRSIPVLTVEQASQIKPAEEPPPSTDQPEE